MGIGFVHRGNFSNTERFLERCKNIFHKGTLDSYGREGVAALSMATPIDSGETALDWTYRIRSEKNALVIEWVNTNVTSQGTPIAVLIQYGHGTRNGGYVQGRDFINPAIQPIFDRIADSVWKEVTG